MEPTDGEVRVVLVLPDLHGVLRGRGHVMSEIRTRRARVGIRSWDRSTQEVGQKGQELKVILSYTRSSRLAGNTLAPGLK